MNRWRVGDAPKDGRKYEMRRRVSGITVPQTVWLWNGWWDGDKYVRRNQFHGGTEWLMFPTHWRNLPTGPGSS